MATIVTRDTGATAVNRPLTNTELDNNFINLNNAIVSLGTGTGSGTSTSTNTAITVGNTDGGTPSSVYGGNVNVDGGSPNSTFVYTDFKVTTATTPRITSIVVTDSSYVSTDDSALGLTGGYVKLIGTGFASGCQVVVNNVAATTTTYVSATEVRAQLPAAVAGTYVVYLVNSDGGVGIRVNGISYGTAPSWTTTSPLAGQNSVTPISLQFVASSDSTVTYSLATGSALPAGLSLSSTGLLSGTVTGVTTTTTYTFSVVATDVEKQDTTRQFSLTITYGDQNWQNTTLLLKTTTPNIRSTTVTDSAATPNVVTRTGTPSTGWTSPYQTTGYWSNYFPSSSYFSITSSANLTIGTSSATVEFWMYPLATDGFRRIVTSSTGSFNAGTFIIRYDNGFFIGGSGGNNASTSTLPAANTWTHIAWVGVNGTSQTLYFNGVSVATAGAYNLTEAIQFIGGYYSSGPSEFYLGYLSNLRVVKGTAVYTGAFTPPNGSLTQTGGAYSSLTNVNTSIPQANTQLLTCQDNRFKDNSSNNYSLTITGTPQTTPYWYPTSFTAPAASPGAGYFPAATSYLTFPLVSLGATFTIEGWFYANTPSASVTIIASNFAQDTGTKWIGYFSTKLSFSYAGTTRDFATTISANTWYHFAFVVTGSTVTCYLNGTQIGTTQTAPTSFTLDTIGGYSASGIVGYLSNFRVVNGTAVYTGNFTPPNGFLTQTGGTYSSLTNVNTSIPQANTVMLLNMADSNLAVASTAANYQNNTFLDTSGYTWPITRNGTPTQGSFTPYRSSGYWSNYLNQSSAYLTFPLITLGTTFTVEGWFYATTITSGSNIFVSNRAQDGGTKWLGFINSDRFAFSYGGTNREFLTTINTNTWYHFAFVITSSTVTFYLNGTQIGATQAAPTSLTLDTISGYGTAGMIGYLSNFRIVDGVAVYTGAFTPSTSPLQKTQSSGTNISAITGSQTSLLTCQSNRFIDNSNGAIAITPSGTPLVQAFQPFVLNAIYSPATYGGSGYFNGSSDYLTTATNAVFALGTSSFTVEYWVYLTSNSGNPIVLAAGNGTTTYDPLFGYTGSSVLSWYLSSNGSAWDIANGITGTVLLNTWNHIAFVRNVNTFTFYINGTSVGSATSSSSIYQSTNSMVIGYGQSSHYLPGYVSNIRVVKGTAVYTGNFTPPTAPLTNAGSTSAASYSSTTNVNTSFAAANTSLLTNFSNASNYDAAWQNDLITVGDTQVSTAQAKWPSTSTYFDGTGDYLNVPSSSQLQLGSGDFTIEAWVFINSLSANSAIVSKYVGGNVASSEFLFQINTNGSIAIALDGAGAEDYFTSSASIFTTNTWYHVAVTKSGSGTNNVKIWQNGIQVAQGTSTRTLNSTSTALTIGSVGASAYFNGYIQDLRISRGLARYTANFTVPTQAFLTYGASPVVSTTPTPTYSLSSSSGTVNEGGSFTITLTTGNVANGTTLPYLITGVSSADIGGMSLSGNFTITDNVATLVVNTTADVTTEGAENFTLTLTSISPAQTVTVAINDTSISPTPTYQFATQPSSINEGSAGTFNVSTTLVADGTNLFWTINNTTTQNADFSATTGYFTVNSSLGSFTITPTADTTTEGSETFTVSIRTGSVGGPVVLTSSSVIINDTSVQTALTATGGTVTSDSTYNYHTFTSDGTFTVVSNPNNRTYDVLIVGGGASAGSGNDQNYSNGGGGGGQVLEYFNQTAQTRTITIGGGGPGGTRAAGSNAGGNTSVSGIGTATGGSPGGSSSYSDWGYGGTAGSGYGGGSGGNANAQRNAGGGGGAGGNGASGGNATQGGGAGGQGITSTITGQTYGGGGAGGTSYPRNSYAAGGSGGGGSGGGSGTGASTGGGDATYYGGGGGGSGQAASASRYAGSGYQGIVVIRYLKS